MSACRLSPRWPGAWWIGLLALSIATSPETWAQEFWQLVPSHTDASLRGLHAIDQTTAWACGSHATVVKTIDGGKSWTRCAIEGLDDKSELRSIHAWSAKEVIVATAGTPCRIYYSSNGGDDWKIVYQNNHPDAFIDAMRFWDDHRGFIFGDPIDSKLLTLVTNDRGETWQLPGNQEFTLRSSEAGFAASNSSMMVFGKASVWIGLGGAPGLAQILISDDAGEHWARSTVDPIPSGKSSGIFSLARNQVGNVVAVGGDYTQVDAQEGNIAWFDPTKRLWRKPRGKSPRGFRSSVIGLSNPIGSKQDQGILIHWICAGPNGCEYSQDMEDWVALGDEGFHALAQASDGSLWACGAKGRVGLYIPNTQSR
ncbi:MAG: WD40/YVTN/BNR-like repeat-containing protein [Planctomycetota bacterium]|jgi:photosystem II stability/assembly factor-like uncharacterized protein